MPRDQMNKRTGALILAAVVSVGACANETPERKHEVGCVAGTLAGGASRHGGGTRVQCRSRV